MHNFYTFSQLSCAIGSLIADVALYPMETVLHRLHLQGSRTIIDNLDSGLEVVPVLTRYEGFFDCCESVRSDEGFGGFYRGFGALILQYAIRLAAIKTCTVIAREIVKLIKQTSPTSHGVVTPENLRCLNDEKEHSSVTSYNNMPINVTGSGEYISPSNSQSNQRIQQVGSGNYIPASSFTEDNDPYRHVRHAM